MKPTRGPDITGDLHILGAGPTPGEIMQKGPGPHLLEAFPNRFPDRDYIVAMAFPEFTSLCPVTGQPDFATITLEYIPDLKCVESKSFKLYLFAYRNHQSFMETITNSILDDLDGLLEPRWCRIKGLFTPRGGTRIHVFAEKFKPMPAERDAELRRAVDAWRSEARPHKP